jgi:hypothetical protein
MIGVGNQGGATDDIAGIDATSVADDASAPRSTPSRPGS